MARKTIAVTLLNFGLIQMAIHPTGLASEETTCAPTCCDECIIPGEPLDPSLVSAGYPYPATVRVSDGWNVYAKGEFLYCAANLGADVYDVVATTTNGQRSRRNVQKRSWSPGFRVALGMNLCPVVLDLQYTSLHNHNTTHFSARANETLSVFPPIAATFANVKTKIELDSDVIIASAQKPVYVGKTILLNGFYGILGGWYQQNVTSEFSQINAPPSTFYSSRQKYWNIGPAFGLLTKLLLPCGFRGLGNVNLSANMCWVNKGVTTFRFPNPATNIIQKLNNNAPAFELNISAEIGLGWEKYFCCDAYHTELTLTYIFNQYNTAPLRALQLVTPNTNVFHGIVVGCRVDF
ncbi:MAG: hypothetical protein JSS30_01475 [Verrucomicrobia bacterium]|nr:hypothetical protein [Verrucomicrobiota bacterium]